MRAALRFAQDLEHSGRLAETSSVTAHLYGSLALTGIGHGTDRAILLGLLGEAPDRVDPAQVESKLQQIEAAHSLTLLGKHPVPFTRTENLLFHRDQMYPTPHPPPPPQRKPVQPPQPRRPGLAVRSPMKSSTPSAEASSSAHPSTKPSAAPQRAAQPASSPIPFAAPPNSSHSPPSTTSPSPTYSSPTK